MKKMVSFISALAMCAVMTAPMFSSAAEGDDSEVQDTTSSNTKTVTQDSTGEESKSDVEVTTTVSSTYTVIIPDGSIDIADPKDISVSAEKVVIDNGQALTVSVKSANEWKLMDEKEGSTASLTYTLTPEDKSALTGTDPVEILSVAAGAAWNSSATEKMQVAISGDAIMSGTYKDTLTFTVAVKDVPQQSENPANDQSGQGDNQKGEENNPTTEPTSQGDQSGT